MNLATYAPIESVFFRDGSAAWYVFAPGVTNHMDIPEGKQFGMVSLSFDTKTIPPTPHWKYTRFKIVYKAVDKIDSEKCRYYRQLSTRPLELAELAHFEVLLEDPRRVEAMSRVYGRIES